MGRIFTILLFVAGVAAAAWGAVVFGTRTWRRATRAQLLQLQGGGIRAVRGAPDDTTGTGTGTTFARVAAGARDSLPAPVSRYFERVLPPGQRLVQLARVTHAGEFALRPNEWKPFSSAQLFSVRPRGFVWDARIRSFPLLPILVRDSYVDGKASMLGALGGVVRVAHVEGTEGLATGALLRYLAESAWFPTALLPGEGVEWTAIDDSTARATLADAGRTVWMDVRFHPSGGIARVSAVRERDVNGESVPTPWEGEFSEELLTVDGMRIPASGQVSWLLPEGRHTYWRARVTAATYEYQVCAPPTNRRASSDCS